jgi:hypothetical protein
MKRPPAPDERARAVAAPAFPPPRRRRLAWLLTAVASTALPLLAWPLGRAAGAAWARRAAAARPKALSLVAAGRGGGGCARVVWAQWRGGAGRQQIPSSLQPCTLSRAPPSSPSPPGPCPAAGPPWRPSSWQPPSPREAYPPSCGAPAPCSRPRSSLARSPARPSPPPPPTSPARCACGTPSCRSTRAISGPSGGGRRVKGIPGRSSKKSGTRGTSMARPASTPCWRAWADTM